MAVDSASVPEFNDRLSVVIRRHLSYFADPQSYEAFMQYIYDDSQWRQTFDTIKKSFNKDEPRHPFSLWKHERLDEEFKDLIAGLTNFDPARRLTAQQALNHAWFSKRQGSLQRCVIS